MDFSLDDEQQLIAATTRRFAERELRGWAGEADRTGTAPDALARVAGEVGFFLDAVPEAADGLLDGTFSHLARTLRGIELGRGCAAMAALLECNVEPALAVAAWGQDAAKDALFAALTAGGLATFWHDARGVLTVEPSGAGDAALIVSGAIGPAPALADAAYALVSATCRDGAPVLFLASTETDEHTAREPMTPSGWRCARWATLSCERARISAGLVLARGDAAERAADQVRAWHRLSLAARAVGVATAAIEFASGYASERVQFDRAIARFESIARMLDENETRIAAARALLLHAAWAIDASGAAPGGADALDLASRARDFACDTVTRATIDAVQIFGGYGFVSDYPVEKLMRDARAFEVVCGNEALTRVLARCADDAA